MLPLHHDFFPPSKRLVSSNIFLAPRNCCCRYIKFHSNTKILLFSWFILYHSFIIKLLSLLFLSSIHCRQQQIIMPPKKASSSKKAGDNSKVDFGPADPTRNNNYVRLQIQLQEWFEQHPGNSFIQPKAFQQQYPEFDKYTLSSLQAPFYKLRTKIRTAAGLGIAGGMFLLLVVLVVLLVVYSILFVVFTTILIYDHHDIIVLILLLFLMFFFLLLTMMTAAASTLSNLLLVFLLLLLFTHHPLPLKHPLRLIVLVLKGNLHHLRL